MRLGWRETSVYALENPPSYPYLTYEVRTDAFGDYDTPLNFSLWYRSSSWKSADAKVEEISAAIGRDGIVYPIDGGYMLIQRGAPFAQDMNDPSDDMVKRKLCSISVRFYTNN